MLKVLGQFFILKAQRPSKRAAVLRSLSGEAALSSRAILLPSRIAQGPEPCINKRKHGSPEGRVEKALRQNAPRRMPKVLGSVQHRHPDRHQMQKNQTYQVQLLDLATSGFMV